MMNPLPNLNLTHLTHKIRIQQIRILPSFVTSLVIVLQCSDTVDWMRGRTSGL